jgi:amino acid adenylation domain-containing protein
MSNAAAHDFEIRPRGNHGPAPLSFAQELLWLMDQASPGLTAWNVPRGFRLHGAVDRAALQCALDAVAARHEALRTIFIPGASGPVQEIVPAGPVPFAYLDLSAVPPETRATELERAMRAEAGAPFDLSRDLLLRAVLIRLSPTDHVFGLTTHHIVSDGWSKGVLLRELSACYAGALTGAAASLPVLPIQFSDYAAWERNALHEVALAEPLAYWRRQLAGPLPALNLPTDRPRPLVPGFAGARRVLVLSPELVTALGALARAHDVTLYMVLLAGYMTLLHRYTGQDDIIVGSPMAGRMEAETEGLIGYFANTLVLRTLLHDNPTFADLLARVRETAFGAFENQQVPFERLVLELQSERQLTHAPLFQAVLTMEDTIPAVLELAGVTTEPLATELEFTKFDLTMLVAQHAEGLRLALWYRTELHEATTADRMLRHLRAIFEAAVARPVQRIGDIELLDSDERRNILVVSTGEVMSVPALVPELFAAAVRRSPDAVAVVSGANKLTYRDLDHASDRVAHRLRALGIGRGSQVGLCLERSVDAIVGLLGIMKTGAAYVPLAPDAPAVRLASQVREAGIAVIVATGAQAAILPGDATLVRLDDDADAGTDSSDPAPVVVHAPGDTAYVLFTSGSTGVPKGVAVTHGNLAHYASAISARLGLSVATPSAFASVSTLAADLGNTAIFPSLICGGTLHLIPAEVATDAARFGEYVAARPIDLLKITPNHLRALLSGPHGDAVLPREWLILGGEASSWELVDQVLRNGTCRVLNHYGPTETTVGCCTFEVTAHSARAARDAGSLTVPIGRSLPNTSGYIVDAGGHFAPQGVAGELWVGGAGVAYGYINRTELTAERFRADPFAESAGARVYRTGDRVRRLTTGDIEFLGRVDDQVKIRGYRVEPAEIEQVLVSHPGVAQATVVSHAATADTTLVAYVVAKTAGYAAAHAERVTLEQLSSFLAERLPDYMVPATIILLDKLPLGANGKVDRAALPAPESVAGADSYVAPGTATEIAVVQIWTEVLKRERIGTADNFLTLGGHSLMAIRVLGRISKQCGVRLPLRALFEAPTVAQLSAVIDAELRAKESELLRVLADVERMSDADVARELAGDTPPGAER